MNRAFTFLLFLVTSSFAGEPYRVKDAGNNNLELITPYGTKYIVGDFSHEGQLNYRLTIPLSELKPEPSPTPTPDPNAPAGPSAVNVAPLAPRELSSIEEHEIERTKKIKITETTEEILPPRKAPEGPPRVIVEYDDTDRFVLEANRLYNRGKFYESANVIEELLRKNPTYVRGWIMKGSVMHMQGQRDLAKKAWQQALSLDPQNPEIKSILKSYTK